MPKHWRPWRLKLGHMWIQLQERERKNESGSEEKERREVARRLLHLGRDRRVLHPDCNRLSLQQNWVQVRLFFHLKLIAMCLWILALRWNSPILHLHPLCLRLAPPRMARRCVILRTPRCNLPQLHLTPNQRKTRWTAHRRHHLPRIQSAFKLMTFSATSIPLGHNLTKIILTSIQT